MVTFSIKKTVHLSVIIKYDNELYTSSVRTLAYILTIRGARETTASRYILTHKNGSMNKYKIVSK